MKQIGIYVIESPTGKIYVGQSRNIIKRWNSYRCLCCENQPAIYRSLVKHGVENHTFSIIHHFNESVPQAVLDKYEIETIALFKNNGFAVLNIKGGGSHGRMAEETKIKLSLAKKGKSRDYFKGELNPYFGRTHSLEVRAKMSVANRGKKTGANNGRAREIIQLDFDNNLIAEFKTISDAATANNISRQGISDCLNDRNKTAAGFIWKYKTNYQ